MVPLGAAQVTYNQTKRRRFTKRQREAFLLRHDATCHWCREPILAGQPWQIEHLIARELMAGKDADADENLAPIHSHPLPCHKAKTRQDVAMIAKSNHVRRFHGIEPDTRKHKPRPIRGRPFPTGAKTKWPTRPFPKRGAP